jgi:fatty acid-binding protein DegV
MKVAVITDSGSNLSLEYFESVPNLKLVPLPRHIRNYSKWDLWSIKT